MSFTNKTPNFELPQWLADDKPTFLSDMNGAFSDIDTAMKANENAAASAQSTADANTLSINGITTDIDGAGGVKARLTAVETAESNLEGTVNTVTSLIGNGTPTTTDQTIIGAINEIVAFTGEGPLDTTAQSVTGAINELVAGGTGAGSLDALSDVDITSPSDGQILIYDGATQKWINASGGGSGSGNLTYTRHHVISVTADGVKTINTLLQELHTAYTAYITAKSSNYRFMICSLYDSILSNRYSMSTIYAVDNYDTKPSFYRIQGSGTITTSRIADSAASNYSYTTVVGANGNTITDHSSDIPTSGVELKIELEEFVVS